MNIIYVPIEPLTERYSEQWYRKFPEAFHAAGYTVTTIDGQTLLDNEIKVGAFLDINSTAHYKMSQLQAISKMFHDNKVKQDTTFFFADIEFWGIESVRLLADMNKIRVKLTGFLHAASYTIEDAFAIAAPYQQYTEVGWIAALDKVFVGSDYHKQAVIDRRLKPLNAEHLADRIIVTKNPLFLEEYHDFGHVVKKKKVLLTNRFDPEKRPGQTLRLFARLKEEYHEWEFVVTTGRKSIMGTTQDHQLLNDLQAAGVVTVKAGLTKEQYHRELAEAYMVVSHSREENYGYCVAESLYYGCVPLLTEGLSHDEFVDSKYTFSNTVSAYYKASYWMDRYNQPKPVIPLDASGMQNIINEIKTL